MHEVNTNIVMRVVDSLAGKQERADSCSGPFSLSFSLFTSNEYAGKGEKRELSNVLRSVKSWKSKVRRSGLIYKYFFWFLNVWHSPNSFVQMAAAEHGEHRSACLASGHVEQWIWVSPTLYLDATVLFQLLQSYVLFYLNSDSLCVRGWIYLDTKSSIATGQRFFGRTLSHAKCETSTSSFGTFAWKTLPWFRILCQLLPHFAGTE